MKLNVEVDLRPFKTPNFVNEKTSRDDESGRQWALNELDAYTLERLCEEFTREVFKKAGKKRPEQILPG